MAKDGLGPAMSALNERQRLFVMAYVANGGNGSKAYRAAGYTSKTGPNIWNGASHLLRREDVKAAIAEHLKTATVAVAPEMLKIVVEEARKGGKDGGKLALALLGRAGITEVVETKHTVEVTVEQKQREIVEFARVLGLDPTKLLGTVAKEEPAVDAEFEEVPPEVIEARRRAGIEDLY